MGTMLFESMDCSESENARIELQANIASEFGISVNLVSTFATCSSVILEYDIDLRETDFGTENGNDMYSWQQLVSTVNSLAAGTIFGSSLFNMRYGY